MDSDISEQEEALLRRELVRARKVMDAALEGWAENSRALTEEIQRLTEGFDQSNETIKDLKAELRDALRQLAAYENRTSPSDKTAPTSSKIKRRSSRSPPSS